VILQKKILLRRNRCILRTWSWYVRENAYLETVHSRIRQEQDVMLIWKHFAIWHRQVYLNVHALYKLAEALKESDGQAEAMHVLMHITWFQVHEASCREYLRLCSMARGDYSKTSILQTLSYHEDNMEWRKGAESPVVSARLLQLVLDANNQASRDVGGDSLAGSSRRILNLDQGIATPSRSVKSQSKD